LLSTTPPPPTSTLFPYTTLFRSPWRNGPADQTSPARKHCRHNTPQPPEPTNCVEAYSQLRSSVRPRGKQIRDNVSQIFVAKQSRSEEHTSELQSRFDLVCRLLLD